MKTILELDVGKILASYGLDTSDRARIFLAQQVRRRCDKYVPYDTGRLKNTAEISADGRTVTYPQSYAAAQYRKYYRHSDPGRGPRWERRMLLNERPQLLAEFERAIKGGTL